MKRKLTYKQMTEEIEADLQSYKNLYFDLDLTAKQVADRKNICLIDRQSKSNLSKALFRVIGRKNKGHGGSRKQSGNKKGKRLVKYFLYEDTLQVFSVPKKYWNYLDLINNKETDEIHQNKYVDFIIENCRVKLSIDSYSKTL